jgi:serine/threonine-protein kinase
MAGEGSRAFLGLQILDDRDARPCALIWVPETAATDNASVAVLKKETDRAASLEHPHVVRVFGLVQLDEGLARVVEFLDGESLRRVLEAHRPLPAPVSALIAADAAMGLHYAHMAGNDDGSPLLHGDVRPETLMVTFSGACKVAGYGALTLAPRETNGRRVLGRRLYCAPEQVLGGRDSVNKQTDVFLLGLVLYECLTGQMPWQGVPAFDDAVVHQPLPLLKSGQIPEPFIEVIARATAKRANDRYPSALAFKEAVEKAAGGLPPRTALSSLLDNVFPENEAARAARRREIDTGIAEFARRQGLPIPPPTAPPEPAPKRAAAPAASGAAKRPAATPAPPTAAASRSLSLSSDEVSSVSEVSDWKARRAQKRRWLMPAGVAAVVAVMGVLLFTRDARSPTDFITERDKAEPAKPAEAAAPPPESASAPSNTAAPEPSNTAATAAPTPSQAAPVEAPPPPVEPPKPAKVERTPVPPSLALNVDPPVQVSIGGKVLGQAPLETPMEPGRYVVKLVDAKQGINTSRTVVVAKAGKTQLNVKLGKGSVALSAPDGATVILDGKVVGKAPVGEIPVYEGQHKLVVTVGKARWQQSFAVRPTERMSFVVETTYE